MSASSSREQILERVRKVDGGSAKGGPATAAGDIAEARKGIPRDYIRRGSLDADACVAKMIERLREYDAEVAECAPEGLVGEIRGQIVRSGRTTMVAPAGIPREWLAEECEWKIDGGSSGSMTVGEIEHADGVLTACFCGVADSGTIVLHHSPAEGRRVISLLPDWHLCILRASQIVETLPEYFDRCEEAGNKGTKKQGTRAQWIEVAGTEDDGRENLPALVTWISGPSATADIEMTRIKGVHGPRFLSVIVVRELGPGNRH